MSTDRAEVQRRLRHFREVCKNNSVKVTHQRMVIFQTVAQTDEHPDVETIYAAVRKQIPAISLDTVYRTLWLLRDLGLISTLGLPRERVRFDGNTSRHHHFVCAGCGLARDFYSAEFGKLPIPREVRAVGSVETAHVELRGLCSRCLKKRRGRRSDRDLSHRDRR